MSDVRIFSSLPNPRVWKALIAADLCGVTVEVVGDRPRNLGNWLWDFDAREMLDNERTEDSPHARTGRRGFSGTLYKTDDFMKAHPYGTVPAAFSPDGEIGVFESNSILRATVRASKEDHGLYGRTPFEASRVDSFLDAGLVFGREAQVYLLGVSDITKETYERMAAAYEFYVSGIDQALTTEDFVATSELTIADIAFVCDTGQFLRERRSEEVLAKQGLSPISLGFEDDFPRAYAHLKSLSARPEFAHHLGRSLEGV